MDIYIYISGDFEKFGSDGPDGPADGPDGAISRATLARSTRVLRRHRGSSLTSSDGSPPPDSLTWRVGVATPGVPGQNQSEPVWTNGNPPDPPAK